MAASTSGMQTFEYPLPTEGRPHTAHPLERPGNETRVHRYSELPVFRVRVQHAVARPAFQNASAGSSIMLALPRLMARASALAGGSRRSKKNRAVMILAR